MSVPDVDGLDRVLRVLRGWQRDGTPMQLHPGDLGWHWRFGPSAMAAAVRTWTRDGRILAVGLLDSPRLLRLAVAPEGQDDDELTARMLADVVRPESEILPGGRADLEARFGGSLVVGLLDAGWIAAQPLDSAFARPE